MRLAAFPQPPAGFSELSRRIGSDPMLVQGPGGNTSVKFGNTMWIKASGTLLSNAGRSGVFTPVNVDLAAAEIDLGENAPKADIRLDPDDGHRPSIETGFHALLPWKYVFHYHSVNALAHLTSAEGEASALEKLSGLNPVHVAYAKPGIPLSGLIRSAIGGRDSRVILLRNHGMIVCGNSIEQVRKLISETEARMRLIPVSDGQEQGRMPDVPGWVPLAGSGPFVTHPWLAERLTSGCYFPDQTVFLGPQIPAVSATDLREGPGSDAQAALVPGIGVYMRSGSAAAARETVECVLAILARVPKSWRPRTLTALEVGELIDWDAEKYRRALSEGSSG